MAANWWAAVSHQIKGGLRRVNRMNRGYASEWWTPLPLFLLLLVLRLYPVSIISITCWFSTTVLAPGIPQPSREIPQKWDLKWWSASLGIKQREGAHFFVQSQVPSVTPRGLSYCWLFIMHPLAEVPSWHSEPQKRWPEAGDRPLAALISRPPKVVVQQSWLGARLGKHRAVGKRGVISCALAKAQD